MSGRRDIRMGNILVVEDDLFIRDILTYALKKEGYTVLEAADGKEASAYIEEGDFELALLDVMLPDTDGFTLCQQITSKDIAPVIMLTAKNDISDKLMGLDIGADDYITKPFDIREVIARISVVLRRQEKKNTETDRDVIVINEDVKIYKNSHQVMVHGKMIELKRKEFQLMLALAENRNIVLSRDRLLEKVWGYDFEGDSRTVDVHVQRLRKRLGDTKENSIIQTVFGVGYKMT